jgi:hypothetical protein
MKPSFIRTDHAVFAIGPLSPRAVLVQTTEDTAAGADDAAPMTLTELRESIRRVLGVDVPLGEPIRLSRYRFQARQAERYRVGRVSVAGDAAHVFPATGVGITVGMLDAVNLAWKLAAEVHGGHRPGCWTVIRTNVASPARAPCCTRRLKWRCVVEQTVPPRRCLTLFKELLADEQPLRRIGALIAGSDVCYRTANPNEHALTGAFAPDLKLRTESGATSVADLMRAARPVFVDLAARSELRNTAREYLPRIDIHTADADHRPADAMLIRPDAHVAWAASVGEPADTATCGLRDALHYWFGTATRPVQVAGRR